MAKKPIFVTLDEDLHAKVKSVAPLRKMLLAEAYEQALRNWLGEVDGESQAGDTPEIAAVRYLLSGQGGEDQRVLIEAVLRPVVAKLAKQSKQPKQPKQPQGKKRDEAA